MHDYRSITLIHIMIFISKINRNKYCDRPVSIFYHDCKNYGEEKKLTLKVPFKFDF